jgi:hypothetical protein
VHLGYLLLCGVYERRSSDNFRRTKPESKYDACLLKAIIVKPVETDIGR